MFQVPMQKDWFVLIFVLLLDLFSVLVVAGMHLSVLSSNFGCFGCVLTTQRLAYLCCQCDHCDASTRFGSSKE